MPSPEQRERRNCDECGSLYFADSSSMDALCPECAHFLYGYPNCMHEVVEGVCSKCGWDGSRSEFIQNRMNAWSELNEVERRAVWDRFYAQFQFQPSYYEKFKPAVLEPKPSVTFDLSPELGSEIRNEIERIFRVAFRTLTVDGQWMYFLDWQHTCYHFYPQVVSSIHHWYPDGDYYILLSEDFSFGTFGHPWQESLCVFGDSLLKMVEEPLRTKLAVVRRSDAE